MIEKSDSSNSTDLPSGSFVSSNFDNLELARTKAAENVININQFYPEIKSAIKIYSDKMSLLGDNSENSDLENHQFPTIENQDAIEEEKKEQSTVFPTELPTEQSKELIFIPKSWTSKGLHALQTMKQVIDNRASDQYTAGMIALKSGQWLQAISHFTHCIHLKPKEPSYYANRAEIFLQLVDFQSAILNYKRACILDPGNSDFFNRLAFLYVFQSQILFDQRLFSSALESIGRAIEMCPNNSGYQIRAVACLASLNRHSECLALLNKLIDQNSLNPDFFVLRAKLHSHFRNFSLSYYDLIEARNLEPDHSESKIVLESMAKQAENWKNLSVELGISNRLQEAINKISLAIDLNPIIGDYHIKRGAFYRRLKNFPAAIDDFIMAMDKIDHNEDHETYRSAQRQLVLTFNDFAVECFNRNCFDDSIQLLNRAIQTEKNEPDFYINRGDCFYRLNQWEFALADYNQAGNISRERYELILSRIALVYFAMAREQFSNGNYEESDKFLSDAIDNHPFPAVFWNVRARCRYVTERFKQARLDLICAILLAGFDKSMESIFSRLFSNKSLSYVLNCQLATVARKELDQIIRRRTELINGKKKSEIRKLENQEQIILCIKEEKIENDYAYQYHKLEKQIKKLSGDKSFMKKSIANITTFPDLDVPQSSYSNILGIVGTGEGNKFFMDNRGVIIKATEPHGWRKFKTGIKMK